MKSSDLAYWVGVAQTDGYFKRQFVKSKKVTRYFIRLDVGSPSIEMLNKFQSLSQKIFSIKGTIWRDHKRNSIAYQFGAKELLPLFSSLDIDFSDPPKPPRWILEKDNFFGAYLAGVIDGDGDVTIRRPKYPQCAIRITSGKPAITLKSAIIDKLSVGVSRRCLHQRSNLNGRIINGTCDKLEFYVSPKNISFFKRFIIPHMTIERKRLKINEYLKMRENFPKHLNKD